MQMPPCFRASLQPMSGLAQHHCDRQIAHRRLNALPPVGAPKAERALKAREAVEEGKDAQSNKFQRRWSDPAD
jgi:hypothetical protein